MEESALGELTYFFPLPNRCARIYHPPQIFTLLLCSLVARVASSPRGLPSRYFFICPLPLQSLSV